MAAPAMATRSGGLPAGLPTCSDSYRTGDGRLASLVDASLERMRVDIGTEPFDVVVTGDSVTTVSRMPSLRDRSACDRCGDMRLPGGGRFTDRRAVGPRRGCVVVAVPQGVRIDGSSVLIVDSLRKPAPQDLWRDARRHLRLDA